eukprot:TRINITY_DN4891_c2_g1_i1.p1 TRINITY_DN4891_c2_g1~~TRINITY_DN4891_c2_g1_i1.p1  ORF type:complete len:214 (-),score=44.04 TRINITY_DN4891_c2_g1_i1:215-856(-)
MTQRREPVFEDPSAFDHFSHGGGVGDFDEDIPNEDEQMIMAATGITHLPTVRQGLLDMGGDLEAAMQYFFTLEMSTALTVGAEDTATETSATSSGATDGGAGERGVGDTLKVPGGADGADGGSSCGESTGECSSEEKRGSSHGSGGGDGGKSGRPKTAKQKRLEKQARKKERKQERRRMAGASEEESSVPGDAKDANGDEDDEAAPQFSALCI